MDKQQIIKEYMSQLGRKGGSVKGSCKARGSDSCRRAVKVRWDKYYARLKESGKTVA